MITRIQRNGDTAAEDTSSIQENLIINDLHCMAVEYRPKTTGKHSSTAVIIMHSDQNYMGLSMGTELAKRGYTTLSVQSIESGELEPKLKRLNDFVCYLRKKEDISKIILMGHSGGATLMSAYQAIAENGPQIFRKEDMVYRTTLQEKLEPADGLMLIDANYGNGVMTLLSMDPAVLEEGNGMRLDPEYDLFDPANGYDRNGTVYSEAFRKKYWKAQKERNNALIAKAQERLKRIESGEGNYRDDEPFFLTAANQPKPNNRMLPQDVHLLSHTKGVYDLLHGDGTVTQEQIFCVRTPEIDRSFSDTYGLGVNKNTVKGFLSSQAILATDEFAVKEDEIIGVAWKSSYASPIGNIEDISVPSLFMGMTGSYEYLASEMIYEHARMEDKTIAFVHGAGHMFAPNLAAEKIPGEFGDTEKALYDYMAEWMKRFD